MASRNPSHQSGPKQCLQTGESRKANCRSAGPSIIDPALQTSSSAQPVRDSDDTDVHTSKGRLLGVEDGLIDALINDPPPRRRLIGETTPTRTSTGSFHRNSQSNFEGLEARLLGVDDRLVDAVALLAAQDADRPANLRTPGSLLSCGWLTAPQLKGFDERCSISDGHTAAHRTWCTCAVAVDSHGFGDDGGVTDEILASAGEMSMDIEPLMSDCDALAAEVFCVPSLLTKAPEPPKTKITLSATDDFIMDSIMFDTPPNSSLLGAENLDDWQAFGSWQAFDSTVSDLLATWD
jgi:hypothetical protein